jgi:hypothetical protein
MFAAAAASVLFAAESQSPQRPDLLVADFEGETYGAWKVEGEAFGPGPARGNLAGQMKVEGFLGRGLVNSFHGGDQSTGQLTSPEITLERKFITFLIGGGGWPNETCLNLLVEGEVVRTATGPNQQPGGSERLAPASWDVTEFAGRKATVTIVDQRTDGWGHINVDHITQSDTASGPIVATVPAPAAVAMTKTLTVDGTHLLVPIASYPPGNNVVLLGIYEGDTLLQNFTASLPSATTHSGSLRIR